jgi:transposase
MYNAVYIPEINDECDRSLVRYRFTIQKDLARCKNRIKSLLLLFGIDVPEQYENSWSKGFTKWLKECDKVKGSARIRLKLMIDQLETLRGVYLDTNREVRKLQISPKFEKPMDILTSVPGIGPLTAIAFMTEVIDIKRFSSMKKLNAFVGYIPMEYSSGEYEHKGKMTIRKNTLLRSLLVEAAWVAIKRDPALALIYNDLKKKMSGKRAIIKIARKLLCRIRYLLLNEIKYEKGILN